MAGETPLGILDFERIKVSALSRKKNAGQGRGTRWMGSFFSFQQLTSAQSPISPLNPVFLPFVGIMMRISFPSNNITYRQLPGKSV